MHRHQRTGNISAIDRGHRDYSGVPTCLYKLLCSSPFSVRGYRIIRTTSTQTSGQGAHEPQASSHLVHRVHRVHLPLLPLLYYLPGGTPLLRKHYESQPSIQTCQSLHQKLPKSHPRAVRDQPSTLSQAFPPPSNPRATASKPHAPSAQASHFVLTTGSKLRKPSSYHPVLLL